MLALTSATGKLGSAVLNAILDNDLINPKELVVCTSSPANDPRFSRVKTLDIPIRYANFDDPSSLRAAYMGCKRLFLVSTPRIELDYNDAPLWRGREGHHRAAIDAAVEVGVEHIYYTSLAFRNPSLASVMRAHIRTEAYLKELESAGKLKVTIIREGLYNESWPLYFGYYFGLKKETRKQIFVAGDGPIAWTAIEDLGFATAKILAAPSNEWAGKTFYLSQKMTWTLEDVARMVSEARGTETIVLKIVPREEYENHYVEKGMDRASVEWWSSTYDALKAWECAIDDPTLEKLLEESGRKPKQLKESVSEMLR